MRAILVVLMLVTISGQAAAKTDAEKAAERAVRDSTETAVKAEKALAKVRERETQDSLAAVKAAADAEAKTPPNVVIPGHGPAEIAEYLTAQEAAQGWTPTQSTGTVVTLERSEERLIAKALLAPQGGSFTYRLTFSCLPEANGTHVYARCQTVTSNVFGGNVASDVTLSKKIRPQLADRLRGTALHFSFMSADTTRAAAH